MNEEKLVRTLSDGDKKALEKIMMKYSGYVCTVARNFSRGALSEEDIDEISVEVFYKLWKCRQNLDIKIGLSAYLSTATRNAVKNRFRSLPPPFEDISELEISSDFLVEDKAEISGMIECLNEGIDRLSPKDRKILSNCKRTEHNTFSGELGGEFMHTGAAYGKPAGTDEINGCSYDWENEIKTYTHSFYYNVGKD